MATPLELFLSLSGLYIIVFLLLLFFTIVFFVRIHRQLVENQENIQRYEDFCRHKAVAKQRHRRARSDDIFSQIDNKIKIKAKNIRYNGQLANVGTDLEKGSDSSLESTTNNQIDDQLVLKALKPEEKDIKKNTQISENLNTGQNSNN